MKNYLPSLSTLKRQYITTKQNSRFEMSEGPQTITTPCRIFIRQVADWSAAQPHPTWDDSFVIVHISESTTTRDCINSAVAKWRKGLLSAARVYTCDKQGFVAHDGWGAPIPQTAHLLASTEGRPHPPSYCVISAPPYGTPDESITATQQLISTYISQRLGIPQRAHQKEKIAYFKEVHEKVRIPNLEAIQNRQAYAHQQSILLARREEDTRMIKLKEARTSITHD